MCTGMQSLLCGHSRLCFTFSVRRRYGRSLPYISILYMTFLCKFLYKMCKVFGQSGLNLHYYNSAVVLILLAHPVVTIYYNYYKMGLGVRPVAIIGFFIFQSGRPRNLV